MPVRVLKALVAELEEGRGASLVSVIAWRGSVPRKDFPRALFLDDGTQIGTVGGGSLDGLAVRMAASLRETGGVISESSLLTSTDVDASEMLCGGDVEFEGRRFEPVEDDLIMARQMRDDPSLQPPRLYLFGGGTVGEVAFRLATEMGFAVSVIEDRPDYATRERFPRAEAVVLGPASKVAELPSLGANDAVLVMARDHGLDLEAMCQVCGTEAGYIGMLGSKRKRKLILKKMSERGEPVARLEGRFFCPVGLEIGAETAEEIALAAVAELVAFRRSKARKG
jgi:xanthine dehydrogenase accessory factor